MPVEFGTNSAGCLAGEAFYVQLLDLVGFSTWSDLLEQLLELGRLESGLEGLVASPPLFFELVRRGFTPRTALPMAWLNAGLRLSRRFSFLCFDS